MKISANYILMNIGTSEMKGVISKKIQIQCAAFSRFNCGKPVMWCPIRTESERKLHPENNSAVEAFSAFWWCGV